MPEKKNGGRAPRERVSRAPGRASRPAAPGRTGRTPAKGRGERDPAASRRRRIAARPEPETLAAEIDESPAIEGEDEASWKAADRPVEVGPDDASGWIGAPEPAAPETEPSRANPLDAVVAAIAGVLALSVFLPWYGPRSKGVKVGVSAWASGSWGPAIFFLALAVLALIGLRRRRIPAGLPFEESLVIEGIGWLCLVGGVLKARFPVTVPYGTAGFGGAATKAAWGAWVGLIVAAGLALMAGRMSPRAPLVLVPGWYRGAAGRVGVAVVVVAVAGAALFGSINSASPISTTGKAPVAGPAPKIFQGKVAPCISVLPVLAGMTPELGYEVEGAVPVCSTQFKSSRPMAELLSEYKTALTKGGWEFAASQQTSGYVVLQLSKPRCGSVSVSATGSQTRVGLILMPCSVFSPAPSLSAKPSK